MVGGESEGFLCLVFINAEPLYKSFSVNTDSVNKQLVRNSLNTPKAFWKPNFRPSCSK